MLDLAKAGAPESSCSDEIMGLGQEESSFDCARDSHSSRRDFVGCPYSDSRSVGILFQETRL
jgi:hypothetical protein